MFVQALTLFNQKYLDTYLYYLYLCSTFPEEGVPKQNKKIVNITKVLTLKFLEL
jgi:hypothetical protein